MFILAHLGIGKKIASPWSRGLPLIPLLIGTLLPDVIDKGLFYGLRFIDQFDGFKLFTQPMMSVITGTRTFGHTAILLIGVLLISVMSKSRIFAALALGMATHLLLDNVSDHLHDVFSGIPSNSDHSASVALLWPFLTSHFAIYPFSSVIEHLENVIRPEILIGEGIGALLLGWDYWKNLRHVELHKFLFSREYRRMKRGLHL